MRRSFFPIIVVIAGLLAIWYAAVVPMNIKMALTAAERSGITVTPVGAKERRDRSAMLLVFQNTFAIKETFALERPRLPAPHQVAAELWNSTVNKKITSKRSLVFHGWITLSSTLLGFAIGTGLGILLAIGIVYNRAMDMSVMPWAIASQTIPILAIAPMIIVVFNSVGLQGIFPKAIISAYLSFFPVVVGMVKGLRSPDQVHSDLLKTYNASSTEGFWKLRLPSSMPFLFASLKIGIAASLVGAIVGELPTGAVRGLGARLLSGSYYGQTIQIWSALLMAALLAAALVALIGLVQRLTLNRMGMS